MSYDDPFRPFQGGHLGDILGELDHHVLNYRGASTEEYKAIKADRTQERHPIAKALTERRIARHEAELRGEVKPYRPKRSRKNRTVY